MSLEIAWTHIALAQLYAIRGVRLAGEVDAAVQRFAAGRAQRLPSGRYGFHVGAHDVAVRVDRRLGTVLVLYVSTERLSR
jgi:hypothetical protein